MGGFGIGTIPPDIVQVSQLKFLDLSSDSVGGWFDYSFEGLNKLGECLLLVHGFLLELIFKNANNDVPFTFHSVSQLAQRRNSWHYSDKYWKSGESRYVQDICVSKRTIAPARSLDLCSVAHAFQEWLLLGDNIGLSGPIPSELGSIPRLGKIVA